MSAPVIFDIAYTPYKLKKGSSKKDIEKHAKERAFFDMSGAENIYNYMTREGKIYGEDSKRLTILEYLQKSTGVFNQNGMLSKDEVADMKFRIKNGEKNIWHGFISFDEQNSEKIDSPLYEVKQILPNHKLYDLRTTFYTRCMECGVAEIAIKKFVGHTLGGLTKNSINL